MPFNRRLLYLLIPLVILFLFREYFRKEVPPIQRTMQNEKPLTFEGYEDFKKQNKSSETINDSLDEITKNHFVSHKYSFSMNLVSDWVSKKGAIGSGIAVQCVQADSGKSIAVIISDYSALSLSGDINSDYDKLKTFLIEQMKHSGVEVKDLEFKKGQLDNTPGIMSTCKASKVGAKYEFFNIQILCIKNGNLYDIAISMPAFLYTENESRRIKEVVNSFKFL